MICDGCGIGYVCTGAVDDGAYEYDYCYWDVEK